MNLTNLPRDNKATIFSFLPAKSLGTLKKVSRSFRSSPEVEKAYVAFVKKATPEELLANNVPVADFETYQPDFDWAAYFEDDPSYEFTEKYFPSRLTTFEQRVTLLDNFSDKWPEDSADDLYDIIGLFPEILYNLELTEDEEEIMESYTDILRDVAFDQKNIENLIEDYVDNVEDLTKIVEISELPNLALVMRKASELGVKPVTILNNLLIGIGLPAFSQAFQEVYGVKPKYPEDLNTDQLAQAAVSVNLSAIPDYVEISASDLKKIAPRIRDAAKRAKNFLL